MMKRPLKIPALAGSVLLAVALAATGCGTTSGGGSSSPAGDGSVPEGNAVSGTSLELMTVDGVQYPKLEIPDKKITFLSHWDENGTELKEDLERLKKVYGVEVECIKTTYTQLPTRLTSLQASGDAPDVFLYYNAGYPSMFAKDMFLPIDDFVDFEDGFWAPAKNASDLLMWKDKHYMVAGAGVARFIWYNKTILDRNALTDPLELYRAGTWTWETLIEYAAELTQDTDADGNLDQWGLGGNSFLGAMMASKNTEMVTMEDGVITNNVKSADIDTVMNLLYQITNVDRSFIWDWQNLFRSGNLAMVYEGSWITSGDEILTQMLKDGEISFVPHPKFEGQAENRMQAEYSGFLIPKGAKNIEGARAFITYNFAYDRSETSRILWEEQRKADGWSDDMIALYKEMNFGDDVLTGKPALTCGDSLRFAWEPMRRMQDGAETWAAMKEEFYPLYQAEIDKETANMGS